MAKVKIIGAGRPKQAGSVQRSLSQQKPNQGKALKQTKPAVRTLGGTRAGKGPSSSKAVNRPSVKAKQAVSISSPTPKSVRDQMAADQAQANYMGGVPKRTLQAAEAAVRQKYQGPSSSHALVRPRLVKQSRTGNMATMARKVSANPNSVPVDSRVFSKPADRVGPTTAAARRNGTKKTTAKVYSKGPKITYQKRAAKGSGKKPYILSA